MISRLAGEYRAMVADLANTLAGSSVPRARAVMRKLVGEVRVGETEDAEELSSTLSAEQALMRLAGGCTMAKCRSLSYA